MVKFAVALINLYQGTISPDHGWAKYQHPYGFCRFHPTCSEYTKQSLIRFGFFSGSLLGLRRILRCHPWQKGGIDPVPSRP